MKYFKSTQEECNSLVSRLDALYGLPSEHTYTFYVPEPHEGEYIVRIKDVHYGDLTEDEKSKVEEI